MLTVYRQWIGENVKLVTDYVMKDEPCYGLIEASFATPTGEHWLQDIRVIRNDQIHHHVIDLGPASEYPTVTPIMLPSLGDDTVAQLQELAEKNRHDDYWAKRAAEMKAESTFLQDHIRQRYQMHEMIRNRSVFGPAQTTQRNGYSRRANRG